MKKILIVALLAFITPAFFPIYAQSTISPDSVVATSNKNLYDVNPSAGSSYSWSLRNGTTYGSISTIAGDQIALKSISIRLLAQTPCNWLRLGQQVVIAIPLN